MFDSSMEPRMGGHVGKRAHAMGTEGDLTILPALPHTDVGKPDKLGLRLLATRMELTGKLSEIGSALPPDDDWCGQRDGRITGTLPAPAGESQRAAVASLLDRYALTWELT